MNLKDGWPGNHLGGTKLVNQVVVLANTVANDERTVVLSRKFAGATSAQVGRLPASSV